MTPNADDVQNELARRHRIAAWVVTIFLALTLGLLAIAYFASNVVFRQGDPSIVMGLWIAILVFGLGAFVLRRTRFAAMRLKDIAAVRGQSALLKTLQDTTIQCGSIAGVISLMGFVITILTGEWTDMLRAGGVAGIVLIYCFPFKSTWQRAVVQLARERSQGDSI